jgi:hypothetical protein
MIKYLLALLTIAVSLNSVCQGQSGNVGKVKREVTVINRKKITIEYRLPPANGKKAFGDVVAYGRIWESGAANLTTETGLKFGKCAVPAGSYTLFPLPEDAGKWTIIFSQRVAKYDQAADLCRQSFGKQNSVKHRKDYTVHIIRTPTDLFNLGVSFLELAWLDAGVGSLVVADF